MQLSESFLKFCSQEQADVAIEGKTEAEAAAAEIKKKKKEFETRYNNDVLTPENEKWFKGKVKVGGVVKALNQDLDSDQNIKVKAWYKEHKDEVDHVFGFGYNQGLKHVKLYDQQARILAIFADCWHLFQKNLDKLNKLLSKLQNIKSPSVQQVQKELTDMNDANKEKAKKASRKRKADVANLKDIYHKEKKRRVETQKELCEFVVFAKSKGIQIPDKFTKHLDEQQKEEEKAEEK